MTELKRCPFCGGEAVLIENEPTEGFCSVECVNCAARGSMTDREHAVSLWNARVDELTADDARLWANDEAVERLLERARSLTAERDKLEDELSDAEDLIRALRRERDCMALDLKRAQLLADDLEAEFDCLTGTSASVDYTESVEHPAHYTAGGIECIDAIESALTPDEFRGYCKGNVIKYVWRERHKGGAEDLRKARWYIERLDDGCR